MKISMRNNVFETNSSSVHSMVLLNKEQAKRWRETEEYVNIEIDKPFFDIDYAPAWDDKAHPPVDTPERPAFIDHSTFEEKCFKWAENQKEKYGYAADWEDYDPNSTCAQRTLYYVRYKDYLDNDYTFEGKITEAKDETGAIILKTDFFVN